MQPQLVEWLRQEGIVGENGSGDCVIRQDWLYGWERRVVQQDTTHDMQKKDHKPYLHDILCCKIASEKRNLVLLIVCGVE